MRALDLLDVIVKNISYVFSITSKIRFMLSEVV